MNRITTGATAAIFQVSKNVAVFERGKKIG